MNNKVKKEKFRKLSIASLVTGIFALILTPLSIVFAIIIFGIYANFAAKAYQFQGSDFIILYSFPSIVFLIGIVPVILGSLDLAKIKSGKYSQMGIGMNIAGITLGGFLVFINVFISFFMFLAVI